MHSHQLGQVNVRFGDRTSLVPAPARNLRSRTVLEGTHQRELPALQPAGPQELADRVEILEAELLKVCRVLEAVLLKVCWVLEAELLKGC